MRLLKSVRSQLGNYHLKSNIYHFYRNEFKQAIEAGLFCRVWWSGDADREAAIKEETKATIRCIPLEQPGGEGVCIGTGRPAKQVAIFGRAY